MKKNKGFTLVEVLGVIVLLSIVFLISYTTILNTIKKSQDDIDNHTLSLITSATKDYMADRKDNYPEVNNNVFCIDINDLIDNNYIDEDTITAQGNSILSKTVKVTYKSDNNSEYEVVGECSKPINRTGKTFAKHLINKANSETVTTYEINSDISHQMYTFSHPATEQTEALTDYRYIGNDPYNYVDFNCDDNGENCETWRVIGVFTVENGDKKEQRIKLIRDDKLSSDMQWNSSYSNNWPRSRLNEYLNEDLNHYFGEDYYHSLKDSSKIMIEPAQTYLGGLSKLNTNSYGTAEDIYYGERGLSRYYGSDDLNYTNFITLSYLSDYAYTYSSGVDNTCYSNVMNCADGRPNSGWLYKSSYTWWSVSIPADSYTGAFVICAGGHVLQRGVKNYYATRPVVYLKSNVKVVDGDGTQSHPYKLSL